MLAALGAAACFAAGACGDCTRAGAAADVAGCCVSASALPAAAGQPKREVLLVPATTVSVAEASFAWALSGGDVGAVRALFSAASPLALTSLSRRSRFLVVTYTTPATATRARLPAATFEALDPMATVTDSPATPRNAESGGRADSLIR